MYCKYIVDSTSIYYFTDSAPYSESSFIISCRVVHWEEVLPNSSRALTSAPCFSNNRTTWILPPPAARCSDVPPRLVGASITALRSSSMDRLAMFFGCDRTPIQWSPTPSRAFISAPWSRRHCPVLSVSRSDQKPNAGESRPSIPSHRHPRRFRVVMKRCRYFLFSLQHASRCLSKCPWHSHALDARR